MIALALLALVQGEIPAVTATVDRSQLAVGEELVLTIRATGTADEPLRIMLPSLDGFEIVSRSERSDVSLGGQSARVTALEIRLRATRAGVFRLGAVTVQQGASVARTAGLTLSVRAGAGAAQAIGPRLRSLLERAPPPRRAGEPALVLVASADRIYVGEQVDIVTAAWFPRDLRARLRRPPTLAPPTLAGVWSYPQPTPPGIAASRQVGGTWYDLFVSHQIVFPLSAGRIELAPASLQYSVPVAMQFFSQEERYTLQSNGITLTVVPLPDAGRPANFAGAVGRSLGLRRSAGGPVRAGEALPVEFTVQGEGNVALWPAPELAWPAGLRHYQDRTDDRIIPAAGRLGGSKLFRSLALPDSAGPLRLPAVEYPYFDLETRTYRTLRAPAITMMVAPAAEARSSRPTPPALIASSHPPLATRVLRFLPAGVWVALAIATPLGWLLLLATEYRRRLHRRRVSDVRPELHASDRRLLTALRSLVPDAESRTGASLVAALRASGVDPAVAARIARVRDEFLAARYGPVAGVARSEREIMREMDELTRVLGGQSRHRERRIRRSAALGLLLPLLVAAPGHAVMQVAAERLYAEGAYRAAADAFARRAAAEPLVPAHWYGLGAAEYRLGSDARAQAAWLRAARLAPRFPSVRRALRLVPPPDPSSGRRIRVAPVTPDELALAALMLWMAGWGTLIAWRPRVRSRSALLIGGGVLLGAGALALRLHYARPLAIVVSSGPLRLSPHGRAPEVAPAEAGAAVSVTRTSPGWALVEGALGRTGWLPADALVQVSE